MELVFGVLLLFTAAPLLCRASVDCSNVDGFLPTPEGNSSYVTHTYQGDGTGSGCAAVTQNCFATVPNNNLRQRTWYLGSTKSAAGIFYKPNWIQNWNIQCPPRTVLHLFPQFLDTEAGPNGECPGFDSIVVDVPGEFTEELCGGEDARISSDLYNDGLGRIFTGGNATVSFCSNAVSMDPLLEQFTGFVVRAMCIDPSFTLYPNCVDFNQVRMDEKGSDFIDRIFKPFENPEPTNILHKRSIDLMGLPQKESLILELMMSGMLNRHKRSVNEFVVIDLIEGQIVTYSDNKLVINFNDGTMAEFEVKWLVANSELLGTRIFDVQLPSTLPMLLGPGKVEIVGTIALVLHTITEDMIPELLIQNLEIVEAINRIANYTFFNYINPYPIICNDTANPLMVPLPGANVVDGRYRDIRGLDFIQEEIRNGTCERSVRINIAPGRNSRVEANIIDFCRFFFNSCNAMLRAACREAINLDRLSG